MSDLKYRCDVSEQDVASRFKCDRCKEISSASVAWVLKVEIFKSSPRTPPWGEGSARWKTRYYRCCTSECACAKDAELMLIGF